MEQRFAKDQETRGRFTKNAGGHTCKGEASSSESCRQSSALGEGKGWVALARTSQPPSPTSASWIISSQSGCARSSPANHSAALLTIRSPSWHRVSGEANVSQHDSALRHKILPLQRLRTHPLFASRNLSTLSARQRVGGPVTLPSIVRTGILCADHRRALRANKRDSGMSLC